MECSLFIQSEETLDLIVERDEREGVRVPPVCVQPINERYEIWYYDGETAPPLSIERYSYTSIPKVFWLMDTTSLDVSGIIALQNQPSLSLKGEGILVGIVDTGIDYTNPLFRDRDGNTRIHSIWDQSGIRGENQTSIADFQYGVIYGREEINEALFEFDQVLLGSL